MTNMRPKTYFLRPDVAIPLGFALLREFWAQKISGRPDKYDPLTCSLCQLRKDFLNLHKFITNLLQM